MTTNTTFRYSVRDRSGKVVKGTIDAESQSAVVAKLRSLGYAPITLAPAAKTGLQRELKLPGLEGKVKLKDLAVMSRQFATMINAGLSLLRSLSILAAQTENKQLARVLGQVRADVESGTSLSVGLAKHPGVFPPLMVNIIRAGEVGGFLDTVLLEVAKTYEAEVRLRSKVKSAMTYPVVVLVMAVLAVIGMLLFIVPVFASMFDGLGAPLPAPTRLLVFLSSTMKILAPALVLLAIAAAIGWRRVKHSERVREVVDPAKLRVPVFGRLFQKVAISRFSRNFGTLLAAGVPILQALDTVAGTTGNVVLTRAVRAVQDSVRQGSSITAPLSQHAVFPPMVVQMLAVGEDTGALDSMLNKISEFYDQEVEATTESLTALLEPLMIAVLGAVIGSMIIALYMPIFSVFKYIQ